jgi:hypothetical protein
VLRAPAVLPHPASVFVRGRQGSMRILTSYDLQGRSRLCDRVDPGFLKLSVCGFCGLSCFWDFGSE